MISKELIEKTFSEEFEYGKFKYINSKTPFTLTCKQHGDFTMTPNDHLNGRGCPRCRESFGERTVATYLDSKKISFYREKSFKGYPYRYDFFLPTEGVLIEFHGKQHFEPVERFGGDTGLRVCRDRDEKKVLLAKRLNFKLLVIPYTKIKEVPEIINAFLKGVSTNTSNGIK